MPGPRAATLRVVAACLARAFGQGAVAIGAFVAASVVLFPTTAGEAAWGATLMLVAMLYSLCLLIASVRGVALIVTGLIVAWIVQLLVLGGPLQPPVTARLVADLLFHGAGAALLVWIALRRWRDIDWMRFRPLRPFRGGAPSG